MQYDSTGFAAAPDGTRIFYGVRGRGIPIVLCDGIGCDGFAWQLVQPDLAASYRTIHWHYRGHGRSGAAADPMRISLPDHAHDLLAALDASETPRAVLMGHSMGTQVCLEAYRAAPDRVLGLLLLCGSYGRITRTFHGSGLLHEVLPSIINAVDRHRGLTRALWGRVPASLAYRIARMSHEIDGLSLRQEDFRRYAEHFARMEPTVFLNMLREAGNHSAEDLLPQVAVPTLVIAAEHDTFTPAALARHTADAIPSCEFLLIKGGTHALPVEQPIRVTARVRKFIDERIAPAAQQG